MTVVKTRSGIKTSLRYAAVAGGCLLLHNVVLISADAVGLHYVIASVVSFLLVSVTGFLLHAWATFRTEASLAAYGRYAAAMALNLPLSVVLLWLAYQQAGLPMVVAAPSVSLVMMLWNFVATRWALVTCPRM